jgi:hypothetical protein
MWPTEKRAAQGIKFPVASIFDTAASVYPKTLEHDILNRIRGKEA